MPTISGSVQNTSTATTQAYSPSVPLSVYRDLAAELEASQAMLEKLSVTNQQLTQENQLLRQEITKAVQSVLHLQKLIDSSKAATYHQTPHSSPNYPSETNRPVTPVPQAHPPQQRVSRKRPPVAPKVSNSGSRRQDFSPPVMDINSPMPEPVFVEEQEVRYYHTSQPRGSQISGWMLVIAILLIVVGAFGAGYLVVRPLFENHNR
jgi:cobalamin biosynthesis Mg chelatase CobN